MSAGKLQQKIDKALYGCVQSARLWYDLLVKVLQEDGYSVNPADPCVLNKLVNGKQSTLLIHVDDILCLCREEKAHDDLANLLKAKFEQTKCDKGLILSYLGMTLDFSMQGRVKVSMEGFIEDLIVDCDDNGTRQRRRTVLCLKVN